MIKITMDTSVLSAVLFLLFPGQGSLGTCVSYISSSREGEIVSPNYPMSYDNGLYCIWEIYLSNGGVVVIHFNDFDLYLAGNCYDYLTIYDGLEGDKLVDEACGDSLYNKTLVSKTSKLLFYFTSSSFNNAKGFNITWKACGENFQGVGNIMAPTFPFVHDPIGCVFHIKLLDVNSAVEIDVSDSELEMFNGLCLIQILDSSQDNVLREICNKTDSPVYISDTNKIALKFRILSTNSRRLVADIDKYDCSQNIVNTSGVIQSPGYPDYFEVNSVCNYILNISIPSGKFLKFHFSELNVSCNGSDVFEIFYTTDSGRTGVIVLCSENHTHYTYFFTKTINLRFASSSDGIPAKFSGYYSVSGLSEIILVETYHHNSYIAWIAAGIAGVVVPASAVIIAVVIFGKRKRQSTLSSRRDINVNVIYDVVDGETPLYDQVDIPEEDCPYYQPGDGVYDVLHKPRESVLPKAVDNTYHVNVKRDNIYDTTQSIRSTQRKVSDQTYALTDL